jgi:prephenate dehydrogenase
VLASVGADGGALAMAVAAGSFTDGTRVAASRPELVRAMCEGNRDALLTAVDDALGRLGAARGSLASTGGLAATIQAGQVARCAFDAARVSDSNDTVHNDAVHIDVAAAGGLARLRELGQQGGRLVGLQGTRCQIQL